MATEQQLTEVLKDQSGNPMSSGGQLPPTYESSDTDVATVSATGLVTKVGVGTANITVKRTNANDDLITSNIAVVNVVPLSLVRYVPGDNVVSRGGTFARTSAATYRDVNGVMQSVATGIIREGNYVGAAQTTLIEFASSINQALHSADIGNAAWSSGDLVKSVSPVAAPDGGAATRLTQTAGNINVLGATLAAQRPNQWCDSMFVRAVPGTGSQWVVMRSQRADLTLRSCWLDVVNGVMGQSDFSSDDVLVEAWPGGWYRIGVRDIGANDIGNIGIKFVHGDGADVQNGDSTRAWDVWGYQAETLGIWTSFIYTTTTGVTRAGDNLIFDWPHSPSLAFSLMEDHYEIGGKLMGEGARWGLGGNFPDDQIQAMNIGANYGHTYHREAGGGAGNCISGAHEPMGTRLEITFRFKALVAVAGMAVNGGTENVQADQAHDGPPPSWLGDGLTVGYHTSGRWQPMALRKIIAMAGDKTMTELRAG